MGWAGFGRTQLRYDMFDMVRTTKEAQRLSECEQMYHVSHREAWRGRDVLDELVREHGGVDISGPKRRALRKVLATILWGQLAAWKISSQLADGLLPLEAKLAATGQAFDEARLFDVMYQYLRHIGYMATKLDRPPQALLDLVLDTPVLAHKILGMQLMIEPMALTIFQSLRELKVEPVLTELLPHFERDEARHIALGVQHLPSMVAAMSPRELRRMLAFQGKLVAMATWGMKCLEPDMRVLGVDARAMFVRGRATQLAALTETLAALDVLPGRGVVTALANSVTELLLPREELRGRWAQVRAAWREFSSEQGGVLVEDPVVPGAAKNAIAPQEARES